MNKDDKDILSGIADMTADEDTITEDDDVLINELFSPKGQPAPKAKVEEDDFIVIKKKPVANGKKNITKPTRSDARYSMTAKEIATLAAAAEDAVADGRFGAALDSVFFTAGDARLALREKLNIRIPIGSSDTDLPFIAAAALIESYLENEDINGADIEEKLRIIIESSEDENKARPSAAQVELRVFECALILCVQAEQSGKHEAIKRRLYGDENSFLCTFLEKSIDQIMLRHRREIGVFSTSVRLQSRTVSQILDKYVASSKNAAPFPARFFAESKPILITSIIVGVLCLLSVIGYSMGIGYLASEEIFDNLNIDGFISGMIILFEVLFISAMSGVSWLVYVGGENKEELKKASSKK